MVHREDTGGSWVARGAGVLPRAARRRGALLAQVVGSAVLLALSVALDVRAAPPLVVLVSAFEAHPPAADAVHKTLTAAPGVAVVTPDQAALAGAVLALPTDGCSNLDPACGGQLAAALGVDAVVTGELQAGDCAPTLQLRLGWTASGAEVRLEQIARGPRDADMRTAARRLAEQLLSHLRGGNP